MKLDTWVKYTKFLYKTVVVTNKDYNEIVGKKLIVYDIDSFGFCVLKEIGSNKLYNYRLHIKDDLQIVY